MVRSGWTEWLHHVRSIEVRELFSDFNIYRNLRVLEVGCGDGFQSAILAKWYKTVISTDVTRQRKPYLLVKNFLICSAEHLPFLSDCFDIVFASQTLEHVKNRKLALLEICRVLKEKGYFLTTVPSIHWRIITWVMSYPAKLIRLYQRYIRPKPCKGDRMNNLGKETPVQDESILRKMGRFLRPDVHGEYESVFEEISAYKRSSWIELIENSTNLKITSSIKFLAYSGHGVFQFKFSAFRELLGKLGITGAYGFIAIKE